MSGHRTCHCDIVAGRMLLFGRLHGWQANQRLHGSHEWRPGHGKQLIQSYGCGSCHTIPGIYTARGTVGPPLMFFSRRTMIAGELAKLAGQPGALDSKSEDG